MDICNLEKIEVILEMPWLQIYNPKINQEIGEVQITRCLLLCRRNTKRKEDRKVEKGKRITTIEEEKIVRQTVDNKKDWEKEKKIEADHRKIEKMVPKRFPKQKKVFGKVESERMPTRKIWDYAIDLKKTFKPQKERIYPLFKNKRKEVQNFVNDQLRKGYIRPSKSPQMLPVFFVNKKNRSKRMVMDYYSLNEQIIKNNYLLLLIMDLIDNMGSRKVFTKIDLQWRFNNIRIKEGNKWKEAFTMHIGFFKLTVMFFKITNLPATFQTIINEILRDLINKEKVIVFVNNMLVGIEI